LVRISGTNTCNISADGLSDGPIASVSSAAETILKCFGCDIYLKEKIELDAKCIVWLEQRMQICTFLLTKNVPTCLPSEMFSSIVGL
jgi:hypothetical protein